ncbi:ATP-dependent protease [Endozoicomonas sp. OPT23]|uniref:YifB family Mg chelatase-like AAA ATPase n=1 Tax=Endozoicomonas sp. OPT23 TaxID=2072845 RepID=UPI00129BB8F7|nr:YifB family Mg chelatase-like AAA ATPase [Endozoicomonas sp. OPT23]MRI32930.1 ATP-dependent protease [Endozoicomonas sp. OPT23]
MTRLAVVNSRAKCGLHAPAVSVEVHLSAGLPALNIVGLPEAAVRESKDRVRSAILNSGFEFPTSRITINLAPADLPKEGGRFDLPIALGILAASGQLPTEPLENTEFIGELALTGTLRSISGALPAAISATEAKRTLVLPQLNAQTAALCPDSRILAAADLLATCAHILGKEQLQEVSTKPESKSVTYPDLSDIRGQMQAKKALMTSAAGAHHLLLYGPPGTGKTMLASRLPGILPGLNEQEALEVTAIHTLSSISTPPDWKQRPFRTPHHTSSAVSLVGGGSQPKPGEISFAHNGVLFMDEFPEFSRVALEVLREPLETGEVVISRAKGQACFPASFQLVAAMNPCPCGYQGDSQKSCRCTPEQVRKYRNKLSGPLLDRIDLHVEVSTQKTATLFSAPDNDDLNSGNIRQKVISARQTQMTRQGKYNAMLKPAEIEKYCKLEKADQDYLTRLCDKLGYSARAVHRILRVSRTLADLSLEEQISKQHLAEAIHYRKLDREPA